MIIGSALFDVKTLEKYYDNAEKLISYVDSLVPLWASHIAGIYDNQRYYVAIRIRKTISLPYSIRMSIANILIDGVVLRGIMNCFVDITELVNMCDKQSMLQMLEQEATYEKYS